MLHNRLLLVIVPFNALKDDLLARARSKGLRPAEWAPNWDKGSARTGLVLVGCEMASSSLLIAWAQHQHLQHQTLHMIVIEEAHVPLISANYRRAMPRLGELRGIGVPLMLLSGTVPPSIVADLQNFYGSKNLHVLRDPSDRPNLQYKVCVSVYRLVNLAPLFYC